MRFPPQRNVCHPFGPLERPDASESRTVAPATDPTRRDVLKLKPPWATPIATYISAAAQKLATATNASAMLGLSLPIVDVVTVLNRSSRWPMLNVAPRETPHRKSITIRPKVQELSSLKPGMSGDSLLRIT